MFVCVVYACVSVCACIHIIFKFCVCVAGYNSIITLLLLFYM